MQRERLGYSLDGYDSCTACMWVEHEGGQMNKDEVRGKADRLKGRVKESVGDLTGNERLRDEGRADRAAGEVEEGIGRGRRKVGNAIKDLGRKISR